MRRRLTLDGLAELAAVGRATLQRIESGEPASLETYARVAAALGLRPELALRDPRRREAHSRSDEDRVHAAMGELQARNLRSMGFAVAVDEPYQHYQFAGRADVVAWDRDRPALLHIENRTRFPNVQETAGSFNAKRAYLPAVLAERLGLRGGWSSVTHALVMLWSAEALHSVRLRRSTFEALCPDPLTAFAAWWSGEPPDAGHASTLVVFDPTDRLGRKRRFVGLEAVDGLEGRYRGYAAAAEHLSGASAR